VGQCTGSILVFALAALHCAATGSEIDGSVKERSACVFPDFGDVRGIDRYATRAEYQRATEDGHFRCERLTYVSDGLPVIAYVVHPAGRTNHTLPVVVFNRGGYVVNNQAPLLITMFHRLAQEGFVVIAPMYRGSDGAPGQDEMGGADLTDLANVLPLAKNLGFADVENMFLYGESRGGVMTLLALRERMPVRAAATFGAFTDLAVYLEGDPRAARIAPSIWPEWAQQKDRILAQRSAIRWADRIGAPVLLIHGGADTQVSPEHTLNLALRLEELQKPYSVIVFAGDSHVLPENRVERDRQAVRWFKQHMR
jgi:dipeptidyl aminopeptidase/acylaminoacyl peptidase